MLSEIAESTTRQAHAPGTHAHTSTQIWKGKDRTKGEKEEEKAKVKTEIKEKENGVIAVHHVTHQEVVGRKAIHRVEKEKAKEKERKAKEKEKEKEKEKVKERTTLKREATRQGRHRVTATAVLAVPLKTSLDHATSL